MADLDKAEEKRISIVWKVSDRIRSVFGFRNMRASTLVQQARGKRHMKCSVLLKKQKCQAGAELRNVHSAARARAVSLLCTCRAPQDNLEVEAHCCSYLIAHHVHRQGTSFLSSGAELQALYDLN